MSNNQEKGYKLHAATPNRPNIKLTDEQVLECRRRYEFEGWALARLAEEYGTGESYMRALLDYRTRSKLIPRRPK